MIVPYFHGALLDVTLLNRTCDTFVIVAILLFPALILATVKKMKNDEPAGGSKVYFWPSAFGQERET
jgi:hypothetical protein